MQASQPPWPDMAQLALSLREQLKLGRQTILADYEQDRRPERLLKRIRQNTDLVLTRAWKQFNMPNAATLVAVGGYGRGELFPYSDIDLLILLPAAPDQALKTKLEQLVQLLWDLGLEIGHSIRTVDECLTESAADITVQTSLMEARRIYGSKTLFAELQHRCALSMDARAFFQDKILELRQRHVKYENTPYSLEPNCKESPGGLRDLQLILWVAKAAGLGDSWRKLAERDMITPTEARQLAAKERAFKDIRIRLHLHAGRREDRLIFDVQSAIADTFGFVTTDTRRASEVLMQRYYWAAKAVTQLNTILLQNIEAHLFPQASVSRAVSPRFNEVNGMIDIAHERVFAETPSALLEIFLLLEQHGELKGMTARTQRAIWHERFRIDAKFRRDPANRELFMQIIRAPKGITHTLRLMNQLSILGRYLPNFRRIIGQMQHDLFHVYTVDQHILMVVRNVRRFAIPEHAHEYPFCSQLMANFSQPWLIYVAALFHDIAKGRGGDHSELGKRDARAFCRAHGMSKEETQLVVFLVEHHLLMSQVAQKQDLSDPEVVRTFVKTVKNERYLTALYLLTVADIRGTSPKVWNAWKGKLLEDLYRMSLRVLGGEAPSADRELRNRQQEAIASLRLYGLSEHAHEALWKTLDVGYFLRHDASEIAWQTRVLCEHTDSEKAIVRCRLGPIGEGLQVVVYLRDRPDLFARICSYFDRKNFSILDAKVQTTRNGYALDTFLVSEPTFADNYRELITLIEHDLGQWLQSESELPPPGKARLSRLSRTFPITPAVHLQPDERGQYHLLSVSASDRTGLLYSIASVLARYKVNLHTAKITTLGERVEDVFLVDGPVLSNARSQIALESDLLDALRV
jgi:[protein-PII] uridylyltransferase